MTSKLLCASLFGAFIGIAAPVLAGNETPATMQVEQAGPGFFESATTLGGKIFAAGREKVAAFRDPDAQVRSLRYENDELKRRLYAAEKSRSDHQVMQALDYNQAMMCLEDIGSVLKSYRPSLLNPAPLPGVNTDLVPVPDQGVSNE